MSGKLYIVATPIGNLEDITLRALRVLREVACVYAEDTRQTRKLLSHYQISVACERYDERFSDAKKRSILSRCAGEASIALTSDAGTPVISDPGWSLVDLAWQMGTQVVPIPGPCVPIAALAACGFPLAHFSFFGFLPRSRSRLLRALDSVRELGCVVFLESPHRLAQTLEAVCTLHIDGLRVCVARELSKHFEEIVRGTPQEVAAHFGKAPVKGECSLVLYLNRK